MKITPFLLFIPLLNNNIPPSAYYTLFFPHAGLLTKSQT